MLNRTKFLDQDRTDVPHFTKIGDTGRSQGIYVPILQQKELAVLLKKHRLVMDAAMAAQELLEDSKALQDEMGVGTEAGEASSTSNSELAAKDAAAQPLQVDGKDTAVDKGPEAAGCLMVDCFNHEDVAAQKAAADKNLLFAERARVNVIKELTKSLLARPMTRKVGLPDDVHLAMQRLADMAPHLPELANTLRLPLLVAKTKGVAPMITPMLLVGCAGVGKSHVALQIADLLGVPMHTVSYAASGSAGNVLSGADKHWGNSSTGIVFDALASGDYANPVICLDEIDKAANTQSTSGIDRHPLNELLALLEPVTAKAHKDRCAEIRVDARHIVWIATANSLKGLSAPLLSRFKLIMVNKPDARAAVMIALSVARSVNTQMGSELKPPSGEVLQWLATVTPRVMRRIWCAAAGWAVAEGRSQVTMNDISLALGVTTPNSSLLH